MFPITGNIPIIRNTSDYWEYSQSLGIFRITQVFLVIWGITNHLDTVDRSRQFVVPLYLDILQLSMYRQMPKGGQLKPEDNRKK